MRIYTLSQILLFIAFTSFFKQAYCQSISRDVTSSAGETLSNNGISVTYVLGETVGDLFSAPGEFKYITAGFIQPDIEIKELLDRSTDNSLILFPNPVRNGLVKLAFNDIPDGNYTIEIIDVLGRILQTKKIDFIKENFLYVDLDVSDLAKGTYFLRVKNQQYKGQTKLIKL